VLLTPETSSQPHIFSFTVKFVRQYRGLLVCSQVALVVCVCVCVCVCTHVYMDMCIDMGIPPCRGQLSTLFETESHLLFALNKLS
jgi:hypothetical protein